MAILQNIFNDLFAPLADIFVAIGYVWPFVVPPLLWYLFKSLWKPHVWGHFGRTQPKVILELIPPRDIEQSPLLMESFFIGLAGSEKSLTTFEEWIVGEYQASYSLEIVSTEGNIHFYIRCWQSYRNLVEANLYAQYPGIELIEVDDYTKIVPRTAPNNEWNIWGSDFILTKPDVYPIRTYKHFEESVTGKMLDPLGSLIEIMSKAGPGQHMWLQYIIVPAQPSWNPTKGQAQIDEWLEKRTKVKEGDVGGPLEFILTPGEREALKAMQENNAKLMFHTKMRYVYVGRRGAFDKSTGVSGVIGTIKQFNDQNLNNLKPEKETKTKVDYYNTDRRLKKKQREIMNWYKTRDNEPYHNRFMFSAEELATVFHIPDMNVVAPTLQRVAAKRGSAPMNLPIDTES
jgi:hypothetical protein